MNKKLVVILAMSLSSVLSGCAHQIAINPDVSMIDRGNSAEKIPGKAGYHFPPGYQEKEVVTPGGGGDRVRYKPYTDIESAYATMLGNVFTNITALESVNESEISKNSIDYVISLEMETDSSSPSTFTWPPTWFSVNLTSTISDSTGKILTNISVKGDGKAALGEFLSDKGLAGKRASFEALSKMQTALLDAPQLRSPVKSGAQTIKQPGNVQENTPTESLAQTGNGQDVASKLKTLKDLYDSGLITKEEFNEKRAKVLGSF